MTPQVTIRQIAPNEAPDPVSDLATILIDCVAGGASVNFLAPLAPERAEQFWRDILADVARGRRQLYVAEDSATGAIIGTVQIVPASQENGPHRGELAKLLVHRSARGAGTGKLLMEAAEAGARAAGLSLLVLDTESGSSAERLYTRLGWTRVGVIPDFALNPSGVLSATTLFYKML